MENITLDYFEHVNGEFEKKELIFSSFLINELYAIKSLFVIRVEGQSMEPLIQHDSLVVADLSQKYFEDDRIFLIYKDDRMWIKKASLIDDKQYFVSINKGYEHLVYELSEVRIIAKALLTFTSL
ncbi:MAG: peptidase [Epsilonproteobacteria bacterium]|nr:peptidase [Campylobacterota bacterium]